MMRFEQYPRLGLSAGIALLAALVAGAPSASAEPPDAQRPATGEPPGAQRDTRFDDDESTSEPSEGYSLAPLTDQSGPGWSATIPGVPEATPFAPRGFGAGLGGAPDAIDAIDLGTLPGLGDWSPSMGIGAGTYDNMTMGR